MNKQKGQMYNWITHTSTHIGGKCPHECEYCSIQDLQRRFPKQLPYSGELRLKEKEFAVNYGTGKTIFIENCNDLFSEKVPEEWIERILNHCNEYPENTYVFQTKNPARVTWAVQQFFPPKAMLGVTIETDTDNNRGNAPSRTDRVLPFLSGQFKCGVAMKTFLTIEPIMKFNLDRFSQWIITGIKPDFVNIGADSKNHGLPEPSMAEVMALAERLTAAGIEIREKHNLERLSCDCKEKV